VTDREAALAADHFEFAGQLAAKFLRGVRARVDEDAVRGAANEALCRAATTYRAGRGASFRTWSARTIFGAMVDELRRNDPNPRHAYRDGTAVATVPLDDDIDSGADFADPLCAWLDVEAALGVLTPRHREMVLMHGDGYGLREIADVHQVTEGRVSQITSAAARRMRPLVAA
jgi:RNA polymerase sigma factor (sigma-70 family)